MILKRLLSFTDTIILKETSEPFEKLRQIKVFLTFKFQIHKKISYNSPLKLAEKIK